MLYCFDDFELDPRARRLLRAGNEVAIEPLVFDVVVYLIAQRTRAVGRDELIAAVWGRVDSSDGTLAQAILKARRLLGDDGQAQRIIRTVARFGYQWVAAVGERHAERANPPRPAATDVATTSPEAPSVAGDLQAVRAPTTATAKESERSDGAALPHRTSTAPVDRLRAWRPLASILLAALVVLGVAVAIRERAAPAQTRAPAPAAGLIAVLPVRVHSAVAQDAWMRLGLMAMSEDALRALPGHALVPSETVLAAAGHDDADVVARVRTATGAALLVAIDGRREHERWLLEATLDGGDGRTQVLTVEADDAVAAGAALGERLRAAIDAGAVSEAGESPEQLVIAARVQAELLDGHAERALALADGDGAMPAASPRLQLLRAKALNRLGRAVDAAAAMRALIAQAPAGGARWLSEAWTTLGYAHLVGGDGGEAERDFRNAIAALGNDRVEAGRAWRGLGNAQSAREDFDAAEASYLRARLELDGSGDRLQLAHLLDDLGTIAGRRGRYDEAIARYEEAAVAAAALGSGEIELGARMNIALAHAERLEHGAALASWRALLPRMRAVDYPAMHRFASVHYADALAETGALAQAAGELAQANVDGTRDALEDVYLDVLHVRLALGEAHAVAADAARDRESAGATPNRQAAIGALQLRAALADRDATGAAAAARALQAVLAQSHGIARAQALTGLADWRANVRDNAGAQAAFGEALALVRATGSPRDLRDVAVDYANFALAIGDVDGARTTAALVDRYAADDFPITLMLARVAQASHEVDAATRLRAQAKALGGARWNAAMAGETAAHGLAAAR